MSSRLISVQRGLGYPRFVWGLIRLQKARLGLDDCGEALLGPQKRAKEESTLQERRSLYIS
jgi:hypothetical protein